VEDDERRAGGEGREHQRDPGDPGADHALGDAREKAAVGEVVDLEGAGGAASDAPGRGRRPGRPVRRAGGASGPSKTSEIDPRAVDARRMWTLIAVAAMMYSAGSCRALDGHTSRRPHVHVAPAVDVTVAASTVAEARGGAGQAFAATARTAGDSAGTKIVGHSERR
jgi:hypothetical protein